MIWFALIATLLALIWAIHSSAALCCPAGQARQTRRSSRQCRNWRASVAPCLFVVAGVVLVMALMSDYRSTWLDIVAASASFLMGMILARALDRDTKPSVNVKSTAIWFIILLAVSAFMLTVFPSTPNSKAAMLFIWALGLPVLGWAGKRIWPWLF